MTVGLPTPKARTASPSGKSLTTGEEGFPPRFGNCSAQSAVPVGGKGERQRWKWQRPPWRQLLLICGALAGVSTVAVPSGNRRLCEWPEVLLANSSGWKESTKQPWLWPLTGIASWGDVIHSPIAQGKCRRKLFAVFEYLVEGLD